MFRAWRGRFFSVLFFLQAALAGVAFQAREPALWLTLLVLAIVLNLIGWLQAMRISNAIADTPTSNVASAAQGYVELHGRAQPFQDTQLLTPYSQLPCLWYRYRVEREVNNKWQHVDGAESLAPFDLVDESGRCTLEPSDAHIQTTHKETRREEDLRHTEEVLLKNDLLYALGTFRSRNGDDLVLDANREEGELLAKWKTDQAELHRRFDLDGDGEISRKEWMLARMAARREVAKQHQALRAQATHNYMSRPDDGRPYLISNMPPEALETRYTWLARLFLLLMLGGLTGLTALLKSGL